MPKKRQTYAKTKEDKRRLVFAKIPESVIEKLKTYAEQNNESFSKTVAKIIEEYYRLK